MLHIPSAKGFFEKGTMLTTRLKMPSMPGASMNYETKSESLWMTFTVYMATHIFRICWTITIINFLLVSQVFLNPNKDWPELLLLSSLLMLAPIILYLHIKYRIYIFLMWDYTFREIRHFFRAVVNVKRPAGFLKDLFLKPYDSNVMLMHERHKHFMIQGFYYSNKSNKYGLCGLWKMTPTRHQSLMLPKLHRY